MIRRNTWVLLVLLVLLVGFAFYIKNRNAQQAAAITPTAASAGGLASASPLFSASLGAPTEINVKDSTGKVVDVARNASGVWVLKAPIDAQASQAAAEAAATQVTSVKVLSTVQLGFDVVGLDKPAYTMAFKFTNGSSHTLTVGALDPLQDGYYTSLDGGSVKIVDKQGMDALIQLLASPPYAATPVPPATLTPIATTVPPTAPATEPSAPAVTGTTVVPTPTP
jgi:hypothetical protein